MNEQSQQERGSTKNLPFADQVLASHMTQEKTASMLANMTGQKRAKELEHLLKDQERTTLLGHLVAGIAHQIIDPLSGINIYLGILEKICNKKGKKEDLEMVRKIVPRLQSASQRIEFVVKSLIDFSRVCEPKFVLTDINKPVETAIKLSLGSLRKDAIKLEEKLTKDLPLCHADPRLIKQVVLNLITDASEAMKTMSEDKKIEVASSLVNNLVVVTISDSRPGVALDLRNKIFDPPYINKHGIPGIGLSIVERIIMDHGGSFGVFDSKWNGVEFRIEIPVKRGTDQA